MADEPLIAVFIDYENLALGVQDMKPKEAALQVDLVLTLLLKKGRVVYKRAYCDWSRFRGATRELHQNGVVMVEIPQTGVSGKNSADIHMVVDAMDLCFAKDHINVFALLSGDSDFAPLVAKLKESDKRVIGCGVKSSTSKLLVASCDEFIYYDDLVRAETPRRTRAAKAKTGGDKKGEAIEQLMDVIRSLAGDYEHVWASHVKQTMSRVHPGFNPAYHGYSSFTALLEDAKGRGLLELTHDRERGNYKVDVRE